MNREYATKADEFWESEQVEAMLQIRENVALGFYEKMKKDTEDLKKWDERMQLNRQPRDNHYCGGLETYIKRKKNENTNS